MKVSKKILSIFLVVLMTLLMSTVSICVMNVSAASPTWKLNTPTDVTDTNAKISSKVTFPSQITCTEGGFYIGTSQSNLKKNSYPDKGISIKSTYITSSFLMSKYKETLKPNTTYYYKIYVIASGTMYTSPVGSFKTTSGPTWKLNNVTNISTTDAKISSRVDFPQARTLTEGGFYLGTSQSNLKKNAYPDKGLSIKSSYIESSFLMSKYKETLTPNTTYYYKIYVVMNGTTYTSQVGSFKTIPTQTGKYTLTYNANGGSPAPSEQTGASNYIISSTVPTRSGYKFLGWATSSSATQGEYTSGDSITLTKNTTLYAVWASNAVNTFNLGEETYSFKNYNCTQHKTYNCFGMSITSCGYYIGALNISTIGGKGTNLNAIKDSATVRKSICNYQGKQGSYANKAIVAGGKCYLSNFKSYDIESDWNAVINYVKNHSHDGKGDLQIGIRQGSGGHSFNFLRYSVVDGQERIYAYDNNYPNFEIFLYKDGNLVKRAPTSGTNFKNDASVPIKCIALRDAAKYFKNVDGFKDTRVIYADTESIIVEGVDPYYMDADGDSESMVMYEFSDEQKDVTIIPLVDNASFKYLEEEYSFENVTDDTYGIFTLTMEDDTGISVSSGLTILGGSGTNENVCKWCGGNHDNGFFQKIIGFFHNIFASIFGSKY